MTIIYIAVGLVLLGGVLELIGIARYKGDLILDGFFLQSMSLLLVIPFRL